jgi:predicted dehydrogenase
MKKLRVGLVGAGLVGQAEHAFYLWEERERYAFVALADAAPSVRAAQGAGLPRSCRNRRPACGRPRRS